jgi:hypothetical protein
MPRVDGRLRRSEVRDFFKPLHALAMREAAFRIGGGTMNPEAERDLRREYSRHALDSMIEWALRYLREKPQRRWS